MNKIHPTAFRSFISVFFLTLLLITSCKKEDDHQKPLQSYTQVNLTANNDEYVKPVQEDATLLNSWGLTFNTTGIPWIASQAGHVSQVYSAEGATLIPPVKIPSPSSLDGGGNPTGIVFNATNDFVIPSANSNPASAARFIFAGVDGVISAWNGTRGGTAYRVATTTSVYTGLAIGHSGGVNYIYGANFKDGRIDVWDGSWAGVSMKFSDPFLPAGYSPFNIQAVGDNLYVMYAKVGSDGDEEHGAGKGLVDIYTMAGKFVKRFATGGKLNAPWGVALAPASFNVNGDELLLVGNFGDGRINAYSKSGKFLGQLTRPDHTTLEIEGLWALQFPPFTSTIDPNRLYFTAGPDEEQDGLFGYIMPSMSDSKSGGNGY